jgi:hypothetical protein
MYHAIKDELDYFEEKFAKLLHFFLSKMSDLDLDPVHLFRIQLYQKVPYLTGSGSTTLTGGSLSMNIL